MVDDNLRKQMVYEQNSKSIGIGYLLWFFFGFIGIHRFYAGKTKSGIVRLMLTFIPFLGWFIQGVLWLIDAFLIPGMINDHNMKTINMLNHGDPDGARAKRPEQLEHAPKPPKAMTEADRRRQEMLEDLRQTGYKKERRDRNPLFR